MPTPTLFSCSLARPNDATHLLWLTHGAPRVQDICSKQDEYEEALDIARRVAQAYEDKLGPVRRAAAVRMIPFPPPPVALVLACLPAGSAFCTRHLDVIVLRIVSEGGWGRRCYLLCLLPACAALCLQGTLRVSD